MNPFDFRPRTRVVFGPGEASRLGEFARELGATRVLVVADHGIVKAGHAQDVVRSLKARRMEVSSFNDFQEGPTVEAVDLGHRSAKGANPDLIVAVGGGSTLDLAKALNVVLSCGGSIRDYFGYGNVPKPLLPMIAVPTTAGTGSEATSSTHIYDPEARARISCGDAKLAFRLAVLDPKLTLTQPDWLTAASGYDAISHAVETLASTRRNVLSESFSRQAWSLLNENFENVLRRPDDMEARAGMLVGSHFAGIAMENAALGVANACAQPLLANVLTNVLTNATAGYKLTHGAAMALTLAPSLEWEEVHQDLAPRLRELASLAGLHLNLKDAGIPEEALPRLAEEAATQWSGKFSARHFDANAALEIYRSAL